MSRETKVPNVSAPRSESPEELKRVVTAMAEALDIRLGRRGDPLDRAITLRELVDGGLVKLKGGTLSLRPNDLDFLPAVPQYTTRPPRPTGVTGSAGFRTATIFWDQPVYPGHSLAEVWRHTANILGNATLIGTSSSTAFTDSTVASGTTYYYWVRFVNASSIYGDFHATSGLALTVAVDVTLILDLLTNAISTSQLVTGLQATIDLITAPSATAGSVNERIEAASAALQGQIDDLLSIPAYNNATTYALDDQVVYLGNLYRALGTTTGNLPTNPTYWQLVGNYTSLGAVVAANSADIAALNYVNVGSTSASAVALAGLQATVNHATTGLPATRALLLTSYSTTTDMTTAISQATTGLVSTTVLNTALGAYTTTALLTTNYYTKTEADTAISQAILDLVSNTALETALGSYVTNSSLTSNYYTSSQTDTAISQATLNLVSNTSLAATLGSYATTAALTTNYTTTTGMNTAISQATQTLVSTTALSTALGAYTTTAALQLNYYTKAEGDALEGQYTVKIDVNGRVAGFGLANTSAAYDGGIHSEFAVVADRFSIVNTSTNISVVPFIVTTVATVLNGVSVPAGVYIAEAFIKNGAIANAKIGNLAVDNAKIADLAVNTAKIADLAVSEAKIENAAISNAKIRDAAITSAKIQDLSVDTIKITGNAVSQSAFATTNPGPVPNAFSLDLVFTSRGGTVMVWGTYYNSSLTPVRTWRLLRNGAVVRTLTGAQLPYTLLMFVDTPPAGTVTYRLECTIVCNLIEMQILEVLK